VDRGPDTSETLLAHDFDACPPARPPTGRFWPGVWVGPRNWPRGWATTICAVRPWIPWPAPGRVRLGAIYRHQELRVEAGDGRIDLHSPAENGDVVRCACAARHGSGCRGRRWAWLH